MTVIDVSINRMGSVLSLEMVVVNLVVGGVDDLVI